MLGSPEREGGGISASKTLRLVKRSIGHCAATKAVASLDTPFLLVMSTRTFSSLQPYMAPQQRSGSTGGGSSGRGRSSLSMPLPPAAARSLPVPAAASNQSGVNNTTSLPPARMGAADLARQPPDSAARSSGARRANESPEFFIDDDIDVSSILQPPQAASSSSSTSTYRSRLHAALNSSTGTMSRDESSASIGNSSHSSTNGLGGGGKGCSEFSDGLFGFANLGNTCFLNSTLQCLLRTSELRRFLLKTDLSAAPRVTPVTSALQQLCRKMNAGGAGGAVSSRSGALNPSSFKQAIGRAYVSFCGTEQQDAQEFLRITLDAVHEECNKVRRKVPYVELKDIDREPPQQTAERWWQNHRERHDSVVQDAFCGQFFVRTKCGECGTVSVACEPFLDLSIPISRMYGNSSSAKDSSFDASTSGSATTIHKSMEDFFGVSKVDSETPFRCSKCAKMVPATREIKIYRLPDVLVIHLKRFRHFRLRSSKIDDFVEFPVGDEQLSMQPYLSDAAPSSSSLSGSSYLLRGVVNHYGSVHGGHYKATVRIDNGPSTWVEFNDETASATSRGICSSSAYLLFYERVQRGQQVNKL